MKCPKLLAVPSDKIEDPQQAAKCGIASNLMPNSLRGEMNSMRVLLSVKYGELDFTRLETSKISRCTENIQISMLAILRKIIWLPSIQPKKYVLSAMMPQRIADGRVPLRL